ncbi:MAG: hypothetical protein ACKVWR_19475, partial [Acidimicrobiales bacterium]
AAELDRIGYHSCLAVLAELDRPSAIPPPGARQLDEGPFSFVADNQAKGISGAPAITLHAGHQLSAERFDDDPATVLADLLELGREWLGDASVVRAELERWRRSGPREVWPEPCCVAVPGPHPVVLAGDAYAGPKVEGAYLSGVAAAEAVSGRLAPPGA